VGRSFVYLTGQRAELHEWPSGRRMVLPPLSGYSSGDAGLPLGWAIKWRADGKELALIDGKWSALLIDAERFRVRRVLRNVSTVWWRDRRLCRLQPVDSRSFRDPTRHAWSCGQDQRLGPVGLSLTDASERGEVMLARDARRFEASFFSNVALLKLEGGSGQVSWTRRLYPKPTPTIEFSHTDFVTWNDRLQSAAVTIAKDTSGGTGISEVVLMGREQVQIPGCDLVPAGKRTDPLHMIQAVCHPSWLGDQVLALLDFVSTDLETTIRIRRLLLFEPRRGVSRVLLENSDLHVAAAATDGEMIAYSVRDQGHWRLIVASRGR
jgi:hypothetical protein